jgi:hypothetical protein
MTHHDSTPVLRPRLNRQLRVDRQSVFIGADAVEIRAHDLSPADLGRILQRFDGTLDFAAIVENERLLTRASAEELIRALDQAGLIDDMAPVECRSGLDVILEIEELVEQYCATTIYENIFWRTCLAAQKPGDVPQKLASGMVIENWHFLFRESYFDAPVLSYVSSTQVRLLLNQFFSEEYGHDEILLRSLNHIGLTREDMADAIPLPETMALCNALAHWAHTDPLFFFTTLGLLEGQGMKHDSFIEACERSGLADDFVSPLRTHANINIKAAHGNLTRAIFQQIPVIDTPTVARLKRQARLFVELYDAFYSGVWRYYTSGAPLLRRVSEL